MSPFQQEALLGWVPRVTSSISIACTAYILREIRNDMKLKRLPTTPITRAVVGMSIFVLFVGFAWFLSTWGPGNVLLCRIQGYILFCALAPVLYNAAILLYANLTIVHGWSSNTIAKKMPERIVHGLIWTWCVVSATFLLVKDKYHSIGNICWIADPPPCYDPDSYPQNELESIDCNAKLYSAVFYCIPLWLALGYTFYGCIRVLKHVQCINKKQLTTTRATIAVEANQAAEQRARTLTLLYTASIIITYSPCIIWSFTFWFDYWRYWMSFIYVLLEPLQGVWNLAIFVMNRRKKTREWIWNTLSKCTMVCFCWPVQGMATTAPNTGEEDNDSDEQKQDQSSWTTSDGHSFEECI